MSEDNVKRSYFTPCRSVGLKRRSTGTPSLAQNSPKVLLAGDSASCTPKRIKEIEKPVRRLPQMLKTCSAVRIESPSLETLTNDENEENSPVEKHDRSLIVDTEQVQISALDLEKQICEAESRLKKLKDEIGNLESVSLNAKQHDRDELNELIRKWRNGCQQALNDLLIEYKDRDNSYTMSTLLSTLGIPPSLVHYSETETDFYV